MAGHSSRNSGGRRSSGRNSQQQQRPRGGNRRGSQSAARRASPSSGANSQSTPGESRRGGGVGGERVEGRHAVRELLLAGTRRPTEIVLSTGLDSAPILDDITALAEEERVPLRELSRKAFIARSDTESAQGVLAEAAPLPTLELEELVEGPTPFLVMLDGITDPHNLGAIFRSADAAGATGLVLPRHRSARISATVAKTAAGAIEHVPIAAVQGIPAAIQTLRKHDVWVVGLDEGGGRSIFELDLADQPLCLVLGAEGPGLSRLTRERCDHLVSIPMRGAVASMNVSAAAAVAMFEITRRRLGR